VSDSSAILVLVDPHGVPLGGLPALPIEYPWWKDMAEIVAGTRERHGIDVVVLRMLSANQSGPPGGAVTYLAEYAGPPIAGLTPVDVDPARLRPHPLRMPWAEIGGPASALAWADGVLAEYGHTVVARQQIRTWNLSSIWRIDTDHGPAWLKEVPPFMAHEGAVLRWLERRGWPTTPVPLGTDGRRLLLADIPGTDRYDSAPDERIGMVTKLLDIQTDAMSRLGELSAIGVPTEYAIDLRTAAESHLPAWLAQSRLDDADRAVLTDLVGGLGDRLADVEACGVPYTLVHGDFHPGNVRSDGVDQVIIDWGDSRIGHPVMDLLRMRDWPEGQGDPVALMELWCVHWRRAVPGCDPERVIELVEPLVPLREALIYDMFLRSIEPSERPYHDDDVPFGILTAIERHRRVSKPATHM